MEKFNTVMNINNPIHACAACGIKIIIEDDLEDSNQAPLLRNVTDRMFDKLLVSDLALHKYWRQIEQGIAVVESPYVSNQGKVYYLHPSGYSKCESTVLFMWSVPGFVDNEESFYSQISYCK